MLLLARGHDLVNKSVLSALLHWQRCVFLDYAGRVGTDRSRLNRFAADLFTQVREVPDDSIPPMPVPPKRVGRYELVFKLASGGMADVYLARETSSTSGFNRVVALKRVHRRLLGEPGYRAMFLDEARLAFQITHPQHLLGR